MTEKFDPYKILGVSKDANDQEIKSKYMQLVRQYHPDRAKSESQKKEFAENFKKVQAAYSCLSDPQKRKNYDMFGTPDPQMGGGGAASMEDILNGLFGGAGGMGGGPGGFSFNFGDGMNGFNVGGSGFDMGGFGGQEFGGRQRRSQPAKPKPQSPLTKDDIEISIFECFNGITKKKYYNRTDQSGRTVSDQVSVSISPGMKAGSRFTFPGKGNCQPNHEPGDLVLTLKITPNQTFQLDDIDIIHTRHVSLQEALECRPRKYTITSVDGVKKEILIPEGEILTPATEKVFPLLGMPNRRSKAGEKARGDMRVRFIIDIPSTLTKEQRESMIQILSV